MTGMGKQMSEPGGESHMKCERDDEGNESSSSGLRWHCEWVDCFFFTSVFETFLRHVEAHEPLEETRETNGKSVKCYCCMWDSCAFNSMGQRTTRYHINYHGFHTRIKAVGAAMQVQQPHLECHLDYTGRNILPELADERVCEWRTCYFSTNSHQRFLEHVNTHVTGRPRRFNHEIVICGWLDCRRENKNMTKLKSHVRSHTQEKVVGCPVCGAQFASKTKFIDHCARQAPIEIKTYKCSYCKKSFASERLLQDHIRLHVNMHKCPYCDMTCPYRYTLSLHIRYRHLSARPFKCTFCRYRCTAARDLKTHYQTHCSENCWVCEQPSCEFSCRSKIGLTAHYAKVHQDYPEEYGCHICDTRYKRGAALTVHLKTKHCYRWASGQSRFRYIKDANGVYRLQTVRYESIEVTEQIMTNASKRKPSRPKKFTCVIEAPNRLAITQDDGSSAMPDDSDTNPDEPDEFTEQDDSDDETDQAGSDMSCSELPTIIETPNEPPSETSPSGMCNAVDRRDEPDADSEFGEALRRHLGLQNGFIKVLKTI